MLLRYEHEFETTDPPEDVAAVIAASRFSSKGFSYLPTREPGGTRVVLRPKYEFGKGNMPMPEILAAPETENGKTRVQLKARPSKWHRSFFLLFMWGVAFFFVLSVIVWLTSHDTEVLIGIAISVFLGAGCCGMFSIPLSSASKDLFGQIERTINGIITYPD